MHICIHTFCIGLKCSVKCSALSLKLLFSADSERSAQYWNSSLGVRMPAECKKYDVHYLKVIK